MTCLRSGIVACLLIGTLTASGCAAETSGSGKADAAALLREFGGGRIPWIQGTPEDDLVERAMGETLSAPLTPESAVKIALLRNRSLRTIYEELGIAQADLVQSGLLTNPFLFGRGGGTRASEQGGCNLDAGVVRSFLSVFFGAAGRRIESGFFERMKPALARRVLDLAFAVKESYYGAVGAGEIAEMRRQVACAAAAAVEEAKTLQATGKLDDLCVAYWKSVAEQSKATHAAAQADLLAVRDHLARLMGLPGSGAPWTAVGRLPDLPKEETAKARWEEIALGRRLDLGALRKEGQAIRRLRDLIRADEWPADASGRRDRPAHWVASPRLSRELPLLDFKEAVVLGLESRLRQNEARVASLAAEIRSDVQSAAQRLEIARSRIRHLREVLAPLRKRIVELTGERYRLTRSGALEFVDAQQKEVDAVQQGIEAIRDYWIVRAELERAAGGDVPPQAL